MKDMDAISEMGSGRNGLMGYFDGGLRNAKKSCTWTTCTWDGQGMNEWEIGMVNYCKIIGMQLPWLDKLQFIERTIGPTVSKDLMLNSSGDISIQIANSMQDTQHSKNTRNRGENEERKKKRTEHVRGRNTVTFSSISWWAMNYI